MAAFDPWDLTRPSDLYYPTSSKLGSYIKLESLSFRVIFCSRHGGREGIVI